MHLRGQIAKKIGSFSLISNRFCTMECLDVLKLSVSDVIVSRKGSNSLGGTIILLALFVQKYIFGQRYILSQSSDTASHFKKYTKYKK